jgi:Ca-activated chloride channel family protein
MASRAPSGAGAPASDEELWRRLVGTEPPVLYPSPEPEGHPSEEELKTAAALQVNLNVSFDAMPLGKAVAFLEGQTGVKFIVLKPCHGIEAEPVTLTGEYSVTEILDRICTEAGAAWVVDHGRVLVALSQAESYTMRVYPIADLLGGALEAGPSKERSASASQTDRAQSLILLIKQACGEDTWEDMTSTGLITADADTYRYPDSKYWRETTSRKPVMLPRAAGSAVEAPAGGRPSLDEELWVIARPEAEPSAAKGENAPASGALMARLREGGEEVPVPLKHTEVHAFISGYIATVEVTQQFHNPYDSKIEAVYVFPLPENAGVNEFVMTIGERRIRGIIREREEAERIYEEARRQGYVASLMTQERPNVFTQKVANIEPGKQIDVDIKYLHTLAYDDGWYEYVFPMVVGPRFNPPGYTEGIGAVGRGGGGISGQKTEVQYLKPHERSGHDIALKVEIDAGVAVEEVRCTSHVVRQARDAADRVTVELSPLDVIPNKDFVLRYKVAGRGLKSGFLAHRDERGGFFTLMVYPPDDIRSLSRQPLELVFVLDCSGSMNGRPIAQAKAAVERALSSLQPDDTFQIIRFSNDASELGPAPVQATAANVARGLNYLKSLEGEGGTMMIEGIRAALDFPHDPRRLRFVSFLTDGYIGNEAEILSAVRDRIGPSRIFSFGVGSSPNRYLLDGMARIGRGAVAYLGLRDSAAVVMDAFFERIAHPAMTDLSVDWGNLRVSEVYPRRRPDLFVGRPVILTGRFDGSLSGKVTLRGKLGDSDSEISIPVDTGQAAAQHEGLAVVWARRKIADLMDGAAYGDDADLPALIKGVALEYGLMSQYTAFVAVDSLTRTAGEHGTTVNVPVPVPEGVRYETTVSD